MNPRPVCALAVCHKDIEQAKNWLRWVAWLSRQHGPVTPRMVVMCSQRASSRIDELRETAEGIRFWIDWPVCPDECETGYPRSASHLFLRLLEYCERTAPDHAIAFCEPDTVPTRPTWFIDIALEYEFCGKPFMSQRIKHPRGGGQHLMGNAVYAANWRELAPRIATTLDAPDSPIWGPGKGQPWDVWAGTETTRDMHESGLYQQIFNCSAWTPENLNRLNPTTALFHRCKDGTLIAELARKRYPEFIATLPKPSLRFAMNGHPTRMKTLGYRMEGWRPIRRAHGWMSVIEPRDALDELVLSNLCGSNGISRMSEAEWRALAA